MKIGNKMFALVMASVLIGTVAATNLQQQATSSDGFDRQAMLEESILDMNQIHTNHTLLLTLI